MTTSQSEAEGLAHKVASYWSARGYTPHIWTTPELVTASPTSHRINWTVRSDMVGGWPKGAPCSTADFDSVTQRESLAGICRPAGTRHAPGGNESVRLSQSRWRGEGEAA
jgi:hypothetical protein